MAKESYYFSHDYNARNDEKVLELRSIHGALGYGIFWMIVETMAENENGGIKTTLIGGLSHSYGVAKPALIQIIDTCKEVGLFYEEGHYIFSKRLLSHKYIRKNLSDAGKLGAEIRWGSYGPPIDDPNGKTMPKERKGKERKVLTNIPHVENRGATAPEPPPFFPVTTDFNGLPESITKDLIRMVSVVKKVDIENPDVLAIWEVFKNQNLTGTKSYPSKEDVYRHFINWGVKQSFRKKPKPREQKPSNKDPVVGVEFINDFAQCKMSDGSIKNLNRNQMDTARYGQIKPNSIKQD